MSNTQPAQDSLQDVQKLVRSVEKDLLYEIVMNLRQQLVSKAEVQRLAKDFLAMLPIKDEKDMIEKLKILGRKYPEVRNLYVKYGIQYHEKSKAEVLELMEKYIGDGQIEQAIEVAKENLQWNQ